MENVVLVVVAMLCYTIHACIRHPSFLHDVMSFHRRVFYWGGAFPTPPPSLPINSLSPCWSFSLPLVETTASLLPIMWDEWGHKKPEAEEDKSHTRLTEQRSLWRKDGLLCCHNVHDDDKRFLPLSLHLLVGITNYHDYYCYLYTIIAVLIILSSSFCHQQLPLSNPSSLLVIPSGHPPLSQTPWSVARR